MTIQFQCPACQTSLRVGDRHGGRQASCPTCAAPIIVPSPTVAASTPFRLPDIPRGPPAITPPDALRAEIRNAPASAQRAIDTSSPQCATAAAWNRVRMGIGLVRAGAMCNLLVVGLAVLFAVAVIFSGAMLLDRLSLGSDTRRHGMTGREAGVLAIILVIGTLLLTGLALMAGTILRIIGYVHWLQVPEESRARLLAIAALTYELIVAGGLGMILLDVLLGYDLFGNLGQLAVAAAGLVGMVYVLRFLRQLGSHLGHPTLPGKVASIAVWLVGSIALLLLSVCFLGVLLVGAGIGAAGSQLGSASARNLGRTPTLALGVISLANLVVYVTIMVKYVHVLSLASKAIAARCSDSPRTP